ncbi:hypothetical protein EV359DRAFT_59243 [Lentinula novae-zelandiae]|nr:hypothetical protein EV359DRAFT_59243 [Lentinula novae-zelandiae]
MGIKDLWPLVDEVAFTCKLRDFIVEHGFLEEHYGLRTVVIGFYKMLCGLSKAGAHCIFVYDGDKRPKIKRGHQVITNELDYLKQSRTMVKHFGYHSHMAPGEAEAKIVDMFKRGIVDIVLSKDSDVFPLGAASVMNLVVPRDKTKARKSWLNLERRERHWPFNCSRSGSESLSTTPQRLSEALRELNQNMACEIQHNKRGKMGSCSPTRAEILRHSDFPTSHDMEVLSAFLKPITSSSEGVPPLLASLRLPTLPNISGIVAFSTEHFAWSPKLTLQHFHNYLWPGVIIRMLSSKYVAYNAENSEILVPRLQNKFETDSKGDLYIPTYSTSIINKDVLEFQGKLASDTISIVFNTSFFIQLTGLNSTTARSRRVDVPVSMIAVVINNLNKVVGLHQMIGSRPPPDTDMPSIDAIEDEAKLTLPLKRKQSENLIAEGSSKHSRVKHLGLIELTDSDDEPL